ncbi:MAG: hypothetical protein FJZ78_01955 [Bacteroidetes bacterium]|nr:hypothetical protein [Bacteroidota bacterium]
MLFAESEEVYRVTEPIMFLIEKPWEKLEPASKQLLQNLCAAVKSKPGPRIVFKSELKENDLNGLPSRLVSFGHPMDALELHKVSDWGGRKIVRSLSPENLTNNPDHKKALWTAIGTLLTT